MKLSFTSPAQSYASDTYETASKLVRHAICAFGSGDVLRFLGGRPTTQNTVRSNFAGEVMSDLKTRPEGVRVKHGINGNTIKAYDKQAKVLRIETTINRPRDFRAYRPSQNDPKGKKKWRVMRRSVADMHRRAEVSKASNHRYLDALGSTGHTQPLAEQVDRVCKPVTRKGQRHRALNPWSPKDLALLEAVSRGEFVINGFRNRDIRQLLFPSKHNDIQQKKQAAHVTRRLAHLRAHGLIKKVPATHRYVLTARGRTTITALLAARTANIEKLTALAA